MPPLPNSDTIGPRPPFWVAGLERAARLLPHADEATIMFGRLARQAARAVGATLPVDRDIEEGLTLVLADTLAEPGVSRLGLLSTASEVRRRIAIAMAVRRVEKEMPDVVASPLAPPVVVLGLPRSGTTALQSSLAAHPALRTTRLWELANPPRAGRRPGGRALPVMRTAALSMFAHSAMPDLRRLHPLGATSPQETNQAMAHSPHHAVRCPLPSYRSWLAVHDPVPDLLRLRILLQTLSSTNGQGPVDERRWVLKSPFHLHDVGALLEVFPGSTIVWTHRDPAAALASWCQLVETVQSVVMARRDPAEIGSEWLASWADAVRSGLSVRRSNPQRFVDVDQAALAEDTAGVTAMLLRRIGIEPNGTPGRPPSRERPASTGNRPASAGLGRYGLDPDEVRHRLSALDPDGGA